MMIMSIAHARTAPPLVKHDAARRWQYQSVDYPADRWYVVPFIHPSRSLKMMAPWSWPRSISFLTFVNTSVLYQPKCWEILEDFWAYDETMTAP
jgi:hypothetical protein